MEAAWRWGLRPRLSFTPKRGAFGAGAGEAVFATLRTLLGAGKPLCQRMKTPNYKVFREEKRISPLKYHFQSIAKRSAGKQLCLPGAHFPLPARQSSPEPTQQVASREHSARAGSGPRDHDEDGPFRGHHSAPCTCVSVASTRARRGKETGGHRGWIGAGEGAAAMPLGEQISVVLGDEGGRGRFLYEEWRQAAFRLQEGPSGCCPESSGGETTRLANTR